MIIDSTKMLIPDNYSLDDSGEITGITQSLLGSWQVCKRRFLYQINGWYHPMKVKNMEYGSMNHEVLDKLYTGHFQGSIKPGDFIDVITETISGYKMSDVFTQEEQQNLKAIAQAVMESYVVYYAKDFQEMRLEAIEETFEIQYICALLRGKIDGRFADKHKGLWHLEHKNYSQINADTLLLKLTFDLQNLFYYLADYLRRNRMLLGVLYNVVRKPSVKKALSNSEIYTYLKDLIRKTPKHYFLRYEIPYGLVDILPFMDSLERKLDLLRGEIEEVRREPERTQVVFYKNECACEMPYSCEFLNVCATCRMVGYRQKSIFSELDLPNNNQTI